MILGPGKRFIFLWLLVTCLYSPLFGSSPSEKNNAKGLNLKTVRTFEIPENMFLESPGDCISDEHDNLYILDQKQRTVFVWDKTGKFITNFGSKGYGPGEIALEDYAGALSVSGDHILVVDDRAQKIHFWDRQFKFVKTITKPATLGRVEIVEAYANRFIVMELSSRKMYNSLVLVDQDFRKLKSIATINDLIYRRNEQGHLNYRPYASRMVVGFEEKAVWYADNRKNWVRLLDLNGKILQEHQVPLSPRDVPIEDKNHYNRIFQSWRGEKDTITFPKKGNTIDMVMPVNKSHLLVAQFYQKTLELTGVVIDKYSGKVLRRFDHHFEDEPFLLTPIDGRLVIVSLNDDEEYVVRMVDVGLNIDLGSPQSN